MENQIIPGKRQKTKEKRIWRAQKVKVTCWRNNDQEKARLNALIPETREKTRQLNLSDAVIIGEITEIRLSSMQRHSPFISIDELMEKHDPD